MKRKRFMLGGNDQFFDMDGMGLGYEIAKLIFPKSIIANKCDFITFVSDSLIL